METNSPSSGSPSYCLVQLLCSGAPTDGSKVGKGVRRKRALALAKTPKCLNGWNENGSQPESVSSLGFLVAVFLSFLEGYFHRAFEKDLPAMSSVPSQHARPQSTNFVHFTPGCRWWPQYHLMGYERELFLPGRKGRRGPLSECINIWCCSQAVAPVVRRKSDPASGPRNGMLGEKIHFPDLIHLSS